MDLLQGYGSDESSSSSSVVDSSAAGPKAAAAAVATQSKKRPTSILKKSSTAVSSTAVKTTGNKTVLSKKKGTRILKLNSVLPPEILERLTRSSVQNASGSRYDTSDEDSDDSGDISDGESSSKKKNSDSQTKSTNKKRTGKSKNSYLKEEEELHQNVGNDVGLNSLLSDLQTVIPTEEDTKSKNKKSKKSSRTGNNDKKNEKMGFAFMNVSSTVVHKKSEKAVVDIHASKKQVTVEDVSSEEDSDDEEDVDQNVSTNAIPMFSSASSRQTANKEQKSSNNSNSNTSIRKSDTAFKRPRHTITAAPTIPTNFQSVKIVNQAPSSCTSFTSVSHGNKYQQQQTSNTSSVTQPSRKMSKREREKALRMGNFDVIDSSYITQNIDSANYAAPDESDLLATASTSNPSASSYNTSNLQMYVPSEGTSVGSHDVSSQQKSKHQIHSLVASARKLEADRARLGAMGVGRGKSTRTDAKRKYGW